MRNSLAPAWCSFAAVALTAYGQNGTFAQSSTQQNASCPTDVQLRVNGTSSLNALYSSLQAAETCGTDSKQIISVEWNGAVEVNQTITVPSYTELRVQGDGYVYDVDAASRGSSSSGGESGITAVIDSVIRGNGSVRLFSVEPYGKLYISGITLQNGWGGNKGGGGIYAAEGTTIIGETCLWDSLSTAGPGGAIAAKDAANVTLKGNNVFLGCSLLSSDSTGGAIHLVSTTLSAQGDVRFENCSAGGYGGGFYMESSSSFTVADATSVSFSDCTAGSQTGDAGGGLCSYSSSLTIGSNAVMSFERNSVPVDGDGGGLFAKRTPITVSRGANLSFVDNYSGDDGGGMLLRGMDPDEYDGEEDIVTCLTLADGSNALFVGNSAGGTGGYGGGLYIGTGCDAMIKGNVEFEDNTGVRAGAMYMDQSRAVISGTAIFVNNTAERWGGAVMVLDSESGLEFNGTVIAQNNSAGRSGGALYLENARFAVTAGGGIEDVTALWEGNSAGYDGGVFGVDGGVVHLEGGFASSNCAAQRGGVLFATGESLLSWTAGESRDNSAASGGSMYIGNSEVNLTDVRIVGDHTPSGGVMFFADADARLINTSLIAPSESAGDFALHADVDSVVRAFSCSFEMWEEDNHLIVSEGELVLDACDFSQSSNSILFQALPPTTVRNAILGDINYASTGNNAFAVFGSGAYTCSTLPESLSCLNNAQKEDCLDADHGMGVLCTVYTAAATGENVSLDGGGSLVELVTASTLAASTPSASSSSTSPSSAQDAVYFPDLVIQELTLRYSLAGGEESGSNNNGSWSSWDGGDTVGMGENAVLWELRSSDGTQYGGSPTGNGSFAGISADNFSWVVMPTSGVLVKGKEVVITLVGSPPPVQNPAQPSAAYNGKVYAEFHVLSRRGEAGSTTISTTATLNATFYYCPAGASWDGEKCVLCVELMADMVDGDASLECDMPGVTLVTLPLAEGYWRGNLNGTNVEPCLLADACKGGRGIVLSESTLTENKSEGDRYCEAGYEGPYCAVCAKNFRPLSGYECLDCQSEWGVAAHAAFGIGMALMPVILVCLILFLLGGTTPFKQLQKKVSLMCGQSKPAGVSQWPVGEGLQMDSSLQREDQLDERARPRHTKKTMSLGARVRRAIPFQQIKILIVVWQILTQFSDLAEIPYPSNYEHFLGMLDVFNFDIPWVLSAMCLVDGINFYAKLVIVTLAPIISLGALGLTYAGAMWWHQGTNYQVIESRQEAKVRHASAALLVLFLVFSSVSTTIFSTFSCDYVKDLEVHMLRADYSISCYDRRHMYYQIYAGAMILVYPVGIPATFVHLLFKHREKINPPAATEARSTPPTVRMAAFPKRRACITPNELFLTDIPASDAPVTIPSLSRDQNMGVRAGEEMKESREVGGGNGGDDRAGQRNGVTGEVYIFGQLSSRPTNTNREEVLRKRARDLDLQPTKFLWEPYEPQNFYYEAVECGRRCLMTGALVFVLPNTAGQVAGACIFAFVTLLVFELIRPHLSQIDGWMYRTGCIVIFFSNFLGLMAKADVSGEQAMSQELFGGLLICVHVIMIMAVFLEAVLAIKIQLQESPSNDYDDNLGPGMVVNTKPKEIGIRSETLDSSSGINHLSPMAPPGPARQRASRDVVFRTEDRTRFSASVDDGHPSSGWRNKKNDSEAVRQFNHEEPGEVAFISPVQRTRPVIGSLSTRKAMEVRRPQDGLKAQLTSGPGSLPLVDQGLDTLDVPERNIISNASAKYLSQSQHFVRGPDPRGTLFSIDDITRSDGNEVDGSVL